MRDRGGRFIGAEDQLDAAFEVAQAVHADVQVGGGVASREDVNEAELERRHVGVDGGGGGGGDENEEGGGGGMQC
jgi:phosphoribosylformimino-5-aminoimidazole carboxamide ribonucleotide (ProFAR) isomerase